MESWPEACLICCFPGCGCVAAAQPGFAALRYEKLPTGPTQYSLPHEAQKKQCPTETTLPLNDKVDAQQRARHTEGDPQPYKSHNH